MRQEADISTTVYQRPGLRHSSNCSSLNSRRVSFHRREARAVAAENNNSSVRRAQSSRESQRKSGNGGVGGAGESQLSWSTSSCAPSNKCRAKSRSVSFRDGLRQGENYQVLMLGATGVGKSALVQQFQQSDANGHALIKITNIYGDNCKRLNDAHMTIIDNPAQEISAEMAISCCDVDAYIVVYSVTDRKSFETAKEIAKNILSQENYTKKAAILVGNKIDLARRRVVHTEEGKALATSNGCKFIETSDWIDYNIAELFDGVLAQIRLRQETEPVIRDKNKGKKGCRKSKTLGSKSWNILKDLMNLINRNVRACDDLQAL